MTTTRYAIPWPGVDILCVACHEQFPANMSGSCRHIAVGPRGMITADSDRTKLARCTCSLPDCNWAFYSPGPDEVLGEVPGEADDEQEDDDLTSCYQCSAKVDAEDLLDVHTRYDDYVNVLMCRPCTDRYLSRCESCEEYVGRYRTCTVFTNFGQDHIDICTPCLYGERGGMTVGTCDHCDQRTCIDEPCCEEDSNGYVENCECERCGNSHSVVKDYGYKPVPEFMADVSDDVVYRKNRFGEQYDATLYMGMELEVEAPGRGSDVTVQEALGDFVYLKEDSSIRDGFEIVSHPATFNYWMKRFNWDAIRRLRGNRVISSSSSCGLHIHISKNAFSGPTHEYRWIMFWHRNQKVLKILAGRDSDYGAYDFDQRRKLVDVVKKGQHSYRRSAINTQNEYTHEVRVFASTVYVNQIKAAIQLVEGTTEYTRHLAAAKVMKDGGYSWTEFIVWLRSNGDKYAQLIKRIVDLDIDREPVRQVAEAREIWSDRRRCYIDLPSHVIQEGATA